MKGRLIWASLLVVSAVTNASEPSPSASAAAAAGAVRSWHADHVVILVIDGPRWSETWGEPERRFIPHRARDLAPQGMLCRAFFNAGATYTTPGHTAITTGIYQDIDLNGEELPAHPGLFQRWLAAHPEAPAGDAWLITSWGHLTMLADTTDPAWKGRWRPAIDCGNNGAGLGIRDDAVTFGHAQDHLAADHPHFALIHCHQPDSAGHARDWDGYLQGIRDTDVIAGELWRFLQADPGFAGRTELFITDDHGRHDDGIADGFVSHGDGCHGCRHIELLAMGPDVKAGATSDVVRNQTDLAVTVAAILGLTIPESTGQVMTEIMKP